MVEVWLPYGNTEIVVRVPEENIVGVLRPKKDESVQDPKAEILRALDNPIGCGKLQDIVKVEERVAVVVDDESSRAPSSLMVPPIIEALGRAGVKDEDITIIVGCGALAAPEGGRRPDALVGEEMAKRVRVIYHDCRSKDLVNVGRTSLGTEVYLNRAFAEADIRILTGDIGFHPFAGYSGGRKSVIPGVAGFSSIKHNHSLLLDPRARAGNIEDNPVHSDMMEASASRIDFILNVVLNTAGGVMRAFAGDVYGAFREGVRFVDEAFKVTVEKPANIVIVSPGGRPLDESLWRACGTLVRVLDAVEEKGVVILAAECPRGHGNEVFYEWARRFKQLKEVEAEIKRRYEVGGEGAYYLIKALERVRVSLVSVMPEYYSFGTFRLRSVETLNMGLQSAFRTVGRKSSVLVVPNGVTTLPVTQK